MRLRWIYVLACAGLAGGGCTTETVRGADEPKPRRVLTGREAFGDWTTDAPGVRRKITVADLPEPGETASAENHPRVVGRPENMWPRAPEGFRVTVFASGLNNPRKIVTAPNGDLFVAESGPGRIRLLRDSDADGRAETVTDFATGLSQPFGIAFYPPGSKPTHVYVANTGSVVRFPYRNGDLKAVSGPEMIVPDIPGGGRLAGGGHWTRDIVFSRDGKRMFVSVGSRSNAWENPNVNEERRAAILSYTPEGRDYELYASGIRNAVGLAIHPRTGELWASVNERDGLGDDVPPEYVTRVKKGGFYGWPWFYIGGHWDPNHKGKHPELKDKVIVPDVLIQAHSASLAMTFYDGRQFPEEYRYDAFAAQHGSWNRARRTGYKVVRIPVRDGKPTGEYEDFLVGFVTPEGNPYGRPVGVAAAKDGSLLVSDDGSGIVWRVSYAE